MKEGYSGSGCPSFCVYWFWLFFCLRSLRSSFTRTRSSLKNWVSMSLHCCSRIPLVTFTWWLKAGFSRMLRMDPAQPALGFMQPITTSGMRAWTMAPEHIWQGSSVTYMVQSSRRQSPIFLLALSMAVISAWDRVFLSVLRRL